MSKILKRPMFRKGGPTNDGIMSMVVPKRAMYQNPPTGGASVEDNFEIDINSPEYQEILKQGAIKANLMSRFAGPGRSERNRLLDLLLEGSLELASGTGAGEKLLPAIAKSFKEPAKAYAKGAREEEAFQRQLKLAGLTQAMSQADLINLAKIKAAGDRKQQFAATLRPERLKTLLGTLEKEIGANPKQAIGLANKLLDFEDFAPATMKRKFKFVAPITTETFKEKGKSITKTGVSQAFIESLDIGDTFLDPSSFDFKIKTTEGIKRLNPDTFEPIGK
jgi:hypothetical protein